MMGLDSIFNNSRRRDRCGTLRGDGGEVLLPSQRARLMTKRGATGIVHSFVDLCGKSDMLSSLLKQSQLKMELVHLYMACYVREFLTLS